MSTTLPSMLEGAFLTREDREAFVRVRDGGAAEPIDVRPLAMGCWPMRVRNAADAVTLERILVGGEHLLPIALDRAARNPTIIHLGCGPGYLLARLAHLHPSARLIGVETEAESARVARENLTALGERATIVSASMSGTPRRHVLSGDAITHDLPSLFDDLGIASVDALLVEPSACAAIVSAPTQQVQRTRQARVRCLDVEAASAIRAAFESASLVCDSDQWQQHGVLAWRRSLAALRVRFPAPQEVIDPGPGLW